MFEHNQRAPYMSNFVTILLLTTLFTTDHKIQVFRGDHTIDIALVQEENQENIVNI